MVLLAACALLLFGCTGTNNGTQSQGQPNGNMPPAAQNPQAGQVGAAGQPQGGAPPDSGALYQPTTGIASLTDNDTSVATGDNDGSAYTELPVDDGTDSPANGS